MAPLKVNNSLKVIPTSKVKVYRNVTVISYEYSTPSLWYLQTTLKCDEKKFRR